MILDYLQLEFEILDLFLRHVLLHFSRCALTELMFYKNWHDLMKDRANTGFSCILSGKLGVSDEHCLFYNLLHRFVDLEARKCELEVALDLA